MESREQPARHTCHCGKSFLRKEHLRRHQATHANPSFVCHICGNSFTRNDVLRRHITVHDSSHELTARSWRACDACHENKTKCDGGQQCSLCTRRGVACVYNRDATATETGDGQDTEPFDNPSIAQTPGDSASTAQDGSQNGNVMALSDADVARKGLTRVAEAASAAISGRTASTKPQPQQHQAREWLQRCLKTYSGRFHERWPLVHAPVLDETTDDALVVSSVVMMGSWLGDPASVRDMIFSIHDRLISHSLRVLNTLAEGSPDEGPWPYDTYRAALINVIFALETGRKSLIPRARRLCSILVLSLRENGVLQPGRIEQHANTHFPGTFRPWVQQHRARWKWLVANVFKADVYLALISNQPPIVQAEELELSVPSTFALWNAWGIDKFSRRDQEEPTDREKYPMAEVARSPQTLVPSGTLVEDVHLGFLGTYQSIWTWVQTRRSNPFGSHVDPTQGEVLLRQLATWKVRLDDISSLWAEPQLNSAAINYILKAYRGEEEVTDNGWEQSVQARLSSLFLGTTLLYHVLSLHLLADIRTIITTTTGSWSLGGAPAAGSEDTEKCTRIRAWAISQEGRTSLLHSILILQAYENAVATEDSLSQSLDPIAHLALCTGGMVFMAWSVGNAGTCNCHSSIGPVNLPLNSRAAFEKDQWIQDGNPAAVQGVALCPCSSGVWMSRFTRALSSGGASWEMCSTMEGFFHNQTGT